MLKSNLLLVLVIYNCFSKINSSPIDGVAVKLQMLPKVDLYRLWLHDNDSVTLGWRPIKQRDLDRVDKEHPLIGIKLQMWEDEKIKLYHFEKINGTKIATEKYEYLSKYIDQIPETVPEVAIVDANVISVEFTNIKPNVHYQMRGQVFTDQGLGPYSDPSGFKILEDEKTSEEDKELPPPNTLNKENLKKPDDDDEPPPFIKDNIKRTDNDDEPPPFIKENMNQPDDDDKPPPFIKENIKKPDDDDEPPPFIKANIKRTDDDDEPPPFIKENKKEN